MDLGGLLKGQGGKQSPVVPIVLIVVILVAGFFLYQNMMGGGSPAEVGVVDTSGGPPLPPSAPGPPGGPPVTPGPDASLTPGPPTGGATTPGPTPPATATAQPPPAPVQPAPTPPAAGATAGGAPAQPPPTPKPSTPTPTAASGEMQAVAVFGKVVVSYPKGWGVDPRIRDRGVFTDKKAYFEVQPADAKAKAAKEIAQMALKSRAAGGKITGQAADRVGGFEAYWITVNVGGKTMKIVGIDSPTRVAIVAYAPSALFAKYKGTFDKMQSAMKFQ